MTTIKILDTGYANTYRQGTPLSVSNRAGFDGGSDCNSFTLNVKNIGVNGGGNLQSETELRNDDTFSIESPVTFNNPVLVLNCSIAKEDIPSSDYHRSWLWQLFRLERTKGIKLLYLSGASDPYGFQTVIEMLGQSNVGGVYYNEVGGLTIPYLVGYVESVGNIMDTAQNSHIEFMITFRLSGP